jgi:hypothetical protein
MAGDLAVPLLSSESEEEKWSVSAHSSVQSGVVFWSDDYDPEAEAEAEPAAVDHRAAAEDRILSEHRARRATDFMDAASAIFCTLMVDVLVVASGDAADLHHGHVQLLNTVFNKADGKAVKIFVLAFLMVYYNWVEHSQLFAGVGSISSLVANLNMGLVFALSLLPFSLGTSML